MFIHSLSAASIKKGDDLKNRKKEAPNGFAVKSESHEPAQHINSTAVSTIPTMNPFLAIQEFDEYLENKDRLKRHGNKILEVLRNIRLAILSGDSYLDDIVRVRDYLQTADLIFQYPEHQELINEILIRAEVEIAKAEVKR